MCVGWSAFPNLAAVEIKSFRTYRALQRANESRGPRPSKYLSKRKANVTYRQSRGLRRIPDVEERHSDLLQLISMLCTK
jgi:hypothetical protein